uniref:Uncharacterized protein n=1 Tax=Glossina pallidipes TaxID=7398 RepID=A0A1A9ZL02_GLOPL
MWKLLSAYILLFSTNLKRHHLQLQYEIPLSSNKNGYQPDAKFKKSFHGGQVSPGSSSAPPSGVVLFPLGDVDDVRGTSVDPSVTHSVVASSSSVVLSVVFSVDFSLGSSHSVVTALAVVVVIFVNSVVLVMHSSSFEGASVPDFVASVVVLVVVTVVPALLSGITHSVVLSAFSLVVVMHSVVVVIKSPGMGSVSQITGLMPVLKASRSALSFISSLIASLLRERFLFRALVPRELTPARPSTGYSKPFTLKLRPTLVPKLWKICADTIYI